MSSEQKHLNDDGRVIVSMDVEGMPWHVKKISSGNISTRKMSGGQQGTRSENRLYTWYAVLAGLSIAGVFSVVWILFTLFLTQVLFK